MCVQLMFVFYENFTISMIRLNRIHLLISRLQKKIMMIIEFETNVINVSWCKLCTKSFFFVCYDLTKCYVYNIIISKYSTKKIKLKLFFIFERHINWKIRKISIISLIMNFWKNLSLKTNCCYKNQIICVILWSKKFTFWCNTFIISLNSYITSIQKICFSWIQHLRSIDYIQ